jgi:hypothetical protein
MNEPLLTVRHIYVHPDVDAPNDVTLVFAEWPVGRRAAADYLEITLVGGRRLHVYPDAVLLFEDGAREGVYLWEAAQEGQD